MRGYEPSPAHRDQSLVVVTGCGAGGLAATLHLLRHGPPHLDVWLIDSGGSYMNASDDGVLADMDPVMWAKKAKDSCSISSSSSPLSEPSLNSLTQSPTKNTATSSMHPVPVIAPYLTAPQTSLGGRRLIYPQGRGLGGTLNVHACIWTAGHRAVFDDSWPHDWPADTMHKYLCEAVELCGAALSVTKASPPMKHILLHCKRGNIPKISDINTYNMTACDKTATKLAADAARSKGENLIWEDDEVKTQYLSWISPANGKRIDCWELISQTAVECGVELINVSTDKMSEIVGRGRGSRGQRRIYVSNDATVARILFKSSSEINDLSKGNLDNNEQSSTLNAYGVAFSDSKGAVVNWKCPEDVHLDIILCAGVIETPRILQMSNEWSAPRGATTSKLPPGVCEIKQEPVYATTIQDHVLVPVAFIDIHTLIEVLVLAASWLWYMCLGRSVDAKAYWEKLMAIGGRWDECGNGVHGWTYIHSQDNNNPLNSIASSPSSSVSSDGSIVSDTIMSPNSKDKDAVVAVVPDTQIVLVDGRIARDLLTEALPRFDYESCNSQCSSSYSSNTSAGDKGRGDIISITTNDRIIKCCKSVYMESLRPTLVVLIEAILAIPPVEFLIRTCVIAALVSAIQPLSRSGRIVVSKSESDSSSSSESSCLIDPCYLDNEADVDVLINGIQYISYRFASIPINTSSTSTTSEPPSIISKIYPKALFGAIYHFIPSCILRWYVRFTAMPYFHACGSCAMTNSIKQPETNSKSGTSASTSTTTNIHVDARLRVVFSNGSTIANLRVADASAIPSIPSAPISATIMALGVAAATEVERACML